MVKKLFIVQCRPLRKKKKKKMLCGSLFTTYPYEDNMWLLSSFQLQHCDKGRQVLVFNCTVSSLSIHYIFFFFLSFIFSQILSLSIFFLSFFHSLNRQRPLKSKRTQARNGDGFKEHPIMNHAWLTHPFQGPSCRRQQIVVQL